MLFRMERVTFSIRFISGMTEGDGRGAGEVFRARGAESVLVIAKIHYCGIASTIKLVEVGMGWKTTSHLGL